MRTSTTSSIRVEPDLRAEVEAVLAEGETLSQIVEASVCASVERLRMQAIAALRSGVAMLKSSSFTCRKAGQSQFLREPIVPFGRLGDVALFESEDEANIAGLAERHELEDHDH